MKIEHVQTAVLSPEEVLQAVEDYCERKGFMCRSDAIVFHRGRMESTSAPVENEVITAHVEGHQSSLERPSPETVWAAGPTPEDAIRARWPDAHQFSELPAGDSEKHTWGRRFWADDTSFKAAGREVPGGVILTWWK